MAHFAKIENDLVTQVIVIANEVILDDEGLEQESIGIEFCRNLFDGQWVQTSYNAKFRGQFAGVGMIYDAEIDEFVIPEHVPK